MSSTVTSSPPPRPLAPRRATVALAAPAGARRLMHAEGTYHLAFAPQAFTSSGGCHLHRMAWQVMLPPGRYPLMAPPEPAQSAPLFLQWTGRHMASRTSTRTHTRHTVHTHAAAAAARAKQRMPPGHRQACRGPPPTQLHTTHSLNAHYTCKPTSTPRHTRTHANMPFWSTLITYSGTPGFHNHRHRHAQMQLEEGGRSF